MSACKATSDNKVKTVLESPSDGRIFQIPGDGFREDLIVGERKGGALAAKAKREQVIEENL